MVHNTPDPPKEEPSIVEPSEVPVIALTDSEDEADDDYAGYTMLPQEANDDVFSESEDVGDASASGANEELPTQSELRSDAFDRGTAEDVRAVWNTVPSTTTEKEPMNQETTEQILKAMKGFNLPSTAIPPWANEVGEEDWKKHLLDKIRADK